MRLIDLTMPLEDGMPYHRLHSPFRILPGPLQHRPTSKWMGTNDRFGRVSFLNEQMVMPGHAGTHIDAPLHGDPDGSDIASTGLSSMVGPASCIDLRRWRGPRVVVSLGQLRNAVGDAPIHPIVLLHTGWSELLTSDPRNYYDNSMGLSGDAALWLREAGATCVGIDAPSVDPPDAVGAPAHMEFLRGKPPICIIENLVNLGQLPSSVPLLVAAPVPVVGASGSPARVFAVFNDDVPDGRRPDVA